MADLVVDGVTFRRNLFGEWCQVSDENGELHIAWQESSCLDEVERLRAEVERLRALITEWDAACALFAGARPMADPEGFLRLSTREHLAVDALTQEARRGQ